MRLPPPSYHARLPTDAPSPTLTNPDMILPCASPSSSPAFSTACDSSHSPLEPRSADCPDVENHGHQEMKRGFRKLFGNGLNSKATISSPTAPDVQDVIEAGRPEEQTLDSHSKERVFLSPSPELHDQRDSAGTSELVGNGFENGHRDRFDGVGGGSGKELHQNGKHSDPESIREADYNLYTSDDSAREVRGALEEDESDPHSHAAMSKRAEQILANAKQRLLTMENNLNRARSGLHGRPSSSMSSFVGDSEPVSAGMTKGHSRVFSETSIPSSRLTTSRIKELERTQDSALPEPSVPGEHSADQASGQPQNWAWTNVNRNGSIAGRLNKALEPLHEEQTVPASFSSSPFSNYSFAVDHPNRHVSPERRSSGDSSLDAKDTSPNGLTRQRSTNQMRDLRDQMQDLKGKISNLKKRAREDSLRRRSLQSLRTASPLNAAESWYTGSADKLISHQTGPEETVRGTDVEATGVADSKNEQDVSDPFIGVFAPAKRDESDPVIKQAGDQPLHPASESLNALPSTANLNGPVNPGFGGEGDAKHEHEHDHPRATTLIGEKEALPAEPVSLPDVDDSGIEDEGIQLDPSEEKPPAYDTLGPALGDRHEDRPDAFDYEHYFLHSSMGHYTRPVFSRTSSDSSSYSIETTKPSHGFIAEPDQLDDFCEDGYEDDLARHHHGHFRQSSGDSESTLGTFATATEGTTSDDDKPDGAWAGPRRPAGSSASGAGSRPPEERSKRPHKQRPKRDHASAQNGLQEAREIRITPAIRRSPSSASGSPSSPASTATATATAIATATSRLPPSLPPGSTISSSSLDDLLRLLSTPPPRSSSLAHASQPATPIPTPVQLHFSSPTDRELVERLLHSVLQVCRNMGAGVEPGEERAEKAKESEGGPARYENRIWRRKLDAARRLLDADDPVPEPQPEPKPE